jgi:hypothetical protein
MRPHSGSDNLEKESANNTLKKDRVKQRLGAKLWNVEHGNLGN